MVRGLDIEDSDASFNMRGRFWAESRAKALADKERNELFSKKSQECGESVEGMEKGESQEVHPEPMPARTAAIGR
ncbi:MAG: hypothetical protein JRJ77_09655 [Deltaproteobacteria bacterium]|nr:hypothetical protein [Deltaproteobacteria bacterium]